MSITATSVDKPTVILVHGAFAESSSWNGGIAPLLDDGYPVLAVANPCAASRATPTTCTASFWFLFGTEDKNIPTAAHRFMADGPVPGGPWNSRAGRLPLPSRRRPRSSTSSARRPLAVQCSSPALRN
jgi:pimeloyl-ACP methyl ester carboxylesterase